MSSLKRLYFGVCILTLVFSCKNENEKIADTVSQYESIAGKTMGTTYHITFSKGDKTEIQKTIDSILIEINQSVSTYIPNSTISIINKDANGTLSEVLVDGMRHEFIKYNLAKDIHFIKNFEEAIEVSRKTDGFFDPTVMPLVNYWGFGFTEKKAVTSIDSQQISKILESVGVHNWSIGIGIDKMELIKPKKSQLDFSALAKGYAVDVIAQFFDSQDTHDYMVEIGGEVFAKGKNSRNKNWSIALNKPKINASVNDVEAGVYVDNVGLASSGNYRNYHVVDGKYYGHEINPKTGFPEMNELLGVSVIAQNCMVSDAYATAFMVMGKTKATRLVEQFNDMEACFFTTNQNGDIQHHQSTNFKAYTVKSNLN